MGFKFWVPSFDPKEVNPIKLTLENYSKTNPSTSIALFVLILLFFAK